MSIDWIDPASRVSQHFTVKECCWLPSANLLHYPTGQEAANLIRVCELLEKVRAFVKAPIRVHCMIRPTDYNARIGGAPHSAHIEGLAVDFDVPGTDCDDLRKLLLPHLADWGARMEQNPGSGWVHLDLREPGPGGRYFKP